MPVLIGQTLGGYRIVEQIGLGGMATVFKAYQPSMDRYVAFKVISTHLAQDPKFVQRFQQEAKVIANLEHLHILPVYDYGEEDGFLYLVMRYVEGGTLASRLKQDSLSLEETRRVVTQVGSALAYAHARGVIHRDFKPSNVLIDHQGDCYLSDFGIAKMAEGTLGLTGSGVVGTPHYMAPEQGQSANVDHRADIYAMGVVIYRIVTDQVPFDAETPIAVVLKHLSEPLPLPRSIKPDLSEALERVVLKALAKDPADRYQSMRELVAAFNQAAQEDPTDGATILSSRHLATPLDIDDTPTTPVGTVTLATTPARQLPQSWLLGMGGLILLLFIVGGIFRQVLFGWLGSGRASTQPDETTLATQVAATLYVEQTAAAQAFTPTPTASPMPTHTPLPLPTFSPTPIPIATPVATVLPDAVVSVEVSEVRAGPGIGYQIVGQAQEGDALQVMGRNAAGDWLEVMRPDGTSGWVSILRLRLNVVLDDIPVAAVPPTTTPVPLPTPTSTPTAISLASQPETEIAPTAAASGPSLRGKLTFSLPQYIDYKVYVVEVGPTAPTELYASIGNARQPALSHDGEWLLVNGTGGGIDAIARLTGDGHQATPVTCPATTAESGRPVWSPDDSRLAFDGLGVDSVNPQIYIHRLDDPDCDLGDNRLLVEGGLASDANGLYPLWGPDDRLYFRSCSTWSPQGSGACGIWSVGPDGGDLRQLTDNVQHLPTNVNDTRLLFMFNDGGNWEIYSVGLTGGQPQNLTQQPSIDVWGTLSPDGQTIAFLSNRSGPWAIWFMNVDGSNPRQWLPLDPAWGEVDPNRIGEERMSWR